MATVRDLYHASGEFVAVVGIIDSIVHETVNEGWEAFLDDAIELLEKKKQEAIEFGSAYDPD